LMSVRCFKNLKKKQVITRCCPILGSNLGSNPHSGLASLRMIKASF
jgi:hypothetical protein